MKTRVVPIDSIILQEDADPIRAKNLAKAIQRIGVFQDSILTVPFPGVDKKSLQFDGATRYEAARELKLKAVAVQEFPDYEKIQIMSWTHHTEISEDRLRQEIDRAKELKLSVDEVKESDPEVNLATVALLFFSEAEKYLRVSTEDNDIFLRLEALSLISSLYERSAKRSLLYKPSHEDRVSAVSTHSELTTLVEFPPLQHDEIISIVKAGKRVPPGLTMHLPGVDKDMRLDFRVSFRAIHIEYPLELLREDISMEEHALNVEVLSACAMPNDYAGLTRVYSWPESTRDIIARAKLLREAAKKDK